MGETEFSGYLASIRPFVRDAQKILSARFDYISFLYTDCSGAHYQVTGKEGALKDSRWSERGCVVRAQKDGKIAEYSFNCLNASNVVEYAEAIHSNLEKQFALASRDPVAYPRIEEAPASGSYRGDVKADPFTVDPQVVFDGLISINKKLQAVSKEIVQVRSGAEFVHVSKFFLSSLRDLDQSYIWAQASIAAFARREETLKIDYEGFSGKKGLEILDELEGAADPLGREVVELLDAGKVAPAKYEVICAPEVSGVLAHEAFGHGVEMDMFVKERAKAKEYMGKRVASPLVNMYDGSAAADQVAGYFFDDEGSIGNKTTIIEKGILRNGLSDALTSFSLKCALTGNGRRESFERKAYSRMSNTFFGPGNDSLEDMVKSIKKGYLLKKIMSGMEDPKNWGIQVISMIGKEIIDGKFTGKLISPVIMSGYVPDVLESVTMTSKDLLYFGTGMCGKGYKEFVKVSTGGPFLKTTMRLG